MTPRATTFHDVIAGIVALMMGITIGVLAIEVKPIPSELSGSWLFVIGYLFRGSSNNASSGDSVNHIGSGANLLDR